ncbi:MAG: DUF2207 domain-containing protein [Candidatus Omnitrophota bacterium]
MKMFKRWLLLTVVFLGASLANVYAWHIEDYKVEIRLEKNSSFVVKEEISADFGYQSKHGIYRDLPTTYNDENGQPYNLQFNLLSVLDENQNPRDYVEESSGNFKRIKIGSAYSTVSGRQTYVITYRVSGAILFLADHDEIYWNAVGTQWDVGIKRVGVSLVLPQSVTKESLKVATYTGRRGSRNTNAQSEIVSDNLIKFEGGNYSSYEGFTIVVGLPKGVLTPSTAAVVQQSYQPPVMNQQPVNYESPYPLHEAEPPLGPWALLLSVLAFIIMWNLWNIFGRDPQLNKSIVVEYKAPEGLKPAEMGTLIDSNVDQRDITSTIIDLAIRGYLKIVQQKALLFGKDYSFVMLKIFEGESTLKPYEKMVLRSIFGTRSVLSEVKLSNLNNKFYEKLPDIETKIKEELISKKYLGSNSSLIVVFYTILSVVIFIIGLSTISIDPWLMGSLILASVIVFLFGLVMPKRTVEGTEILSKILGFKEFLQRTEKDQIQKADQQEIFEKMLPYAICLGMSTKWATKFDGLYTQPPQWFAGDYGGVFYYDHFIHDLDRSLGSMGSSFYSSPQTVSSGGGFSVGGGSGGGFGGGGGGSW